MKYINAWSEGNEICLLHRNNKGKKTIKHIKDFQWYFLVDNNKEDLEVLSFLQSKVIGFNCESNGKYLRCYYQKRTDGISFAKKIGREYDRNIFAKGAKLDDSQRILLKILTYLDKHEVKYYEADLSLFRRWVSDNDFEIEDNWNECFMDIETDNKNKGFLNIKDHRIISFQCYDKKKDRYDLFIVDKNNDTQEKEVIIKYLKYLDDIDIVYAWHGKGYDFVVIGARCEYHNINFDWRKIHQVDQMDIFKRMMYARGDSSVRTSNSLENVSQELLGKGKVDTGGLQHVELFEQDREKFIKYCKTDVQNMVEIEDKTQFLKVNNIMCSIGHVFPNDYGVLDKIDGFMLKLGSQKNIHFPTFKRLDKAKEDYSGGYVKQPKLGLYDNIAVFDFSSLYPSIIRSFNMSPETKLTDDEIINRDHISGIESNFVTAINGTKFDIEKQGLASWIYTEFVDKNRKIYKDKMKTVSPDTPEYVNYFSQEYAIKSFGLAFYGAFGSKMSRYYDIDIASAVTDTGRYLITEVIKFKEKLGHNVIYGDTDSDFVKILLEKCDELVDKCNEFINDLMKSKFNISKHFVNLEYEKFFERIFFLGKKRYAGLVIFHKGNTKPFIDIRGLEYVRSDSIKLTRSFQYHIIKMILEDKADNKQILEQILAMRDYVMSGNLSKEEVTISQGISKSTYKTETVHLRVSEILKKRGEHVFVGMKIQYIVIDSTNNLVGIPANDFNGNYDIEYYWNNKIYPPVKRILNVCYKDHDWEKYIICSKIEECNLCVLNKTREDIVNFRESRNPDILFLIESPGRKKDEQELVKWILYLKLMKGSYSVGTMVRCKPPDDRMPAQVEINACRKHLRESLKKLNPKIIITIGKIARNHFLKMENGDSIIEQSGHVYETKKGNPIGVLIDPAFVLKNNYNIKNDLDNLKQSLIKYTDKFSII